MYSFMVQKVSSHSGPQPFAFVAFNALKKGYKWSEYGEINLFKAANFPVRDCISFFVVGGFILQIAQICLGAISIPLWLIRKPKKLPELTPNVHLAGFNHNRCRRSKVNASFR